MSSNICGNCSNFKPKQGERFFNCTSAVQAGVKYGMQVRADTRACDAFAPIKVSPPLQQPPTKKGPAPAKDRQRPVGLCPWGRLIMVAAIVVAILLLSFLGYTCAKNLTSPAPTPTPEPTEIPLTPSPTPIPTRPPTPTPVPTPVPVVYLEFGGFSTHPIIRATVANPVRVNSYRTYLGSTINAPVGTVFIICDTTILNMASQFQVVTSDWFSLFTALGSRYLPSQYSVVDALPVRVEIKAGGSTSGKIMFVVPQSDWELEVRCANGPPGQQAAWKLPW